MRFGSTILAALFAAAFAAAADWPQWRGPNRDGTSGDADLAVQWPKGGPKLAWSLTSPDAIGTGYGTASVVGDKVYVLGATGASQGATEFVTCLGLKDGGKLWQTKLKTSAGKFSDGWGGGPRGTPTVDAGRVFVLGVTGDLVCLSADKGEIQWAKNLVKDFGGRIPNWGYSESPLIDGDRLVCTPGSGTGMVALDKATGKTAWACKELKDGAGYSSAMISTGGGVKQYVQQTSSSSVGVRASDGKLLWKTKELSRSTAVIPSPVVHGDYVFFTAGYGAGCECVKLEAAGDGVKATTVYTSKTMVNQHGGVVRQGDFVYGFSDNGGWTCLKLDAGEKAVWRNPGGGKGSVSLAGGYLFCYSMNDGTLTRVKATEKGYEPAGKFEIPKTSKLRPSRGKVWAHPVIANGKLLLRDYEMLYAYDVGR